MSPGATLLTPHIFHMAHVRVTQRHQLSWAASRSLSLASVPCDAALAVLLLNRLQCKMCFIEQILELNISLIQAKIQRHSIALFILTYS